jgi:glutamate--cysteine ligase
LYSSAEQRLARLLDAGAAPALRGGRVGLEKEGLRVASDGTIAQTRHPSALGSALTHPHITTDYSEALLELITPPLETRAEALTFLREAHKFVYENLVEGETLWVTSMPCVLEDGANIPIADYGSSNAGRMKTVYRRGLGHRYGRSMQVIAGVHFNYSLAAAFWPLLQRAESARGPLQPFVSEAYMGMIRNLQRLGWLIPYLFGASPAVCKSFLGGRLSTLPEFNASTYYDPFGTSLRMGDIGYQNSLEEGRGFKANYDSLDAYVRSLIWATEISCPDNERIGLLDPDGEYRQLSTGVLQIENEHYSTIRPKQILEWMEKPALALRRRGIRYVELRSLDVNAFEPLGISEEQMYFLELFLLFCLLNDSPRIAASESRAIDANQLLAAHRGREPGLRLMLGGREVELRVWAGELLEALATLAQVLDGQDPDQPYATALARQQHLVDHPDLTPAARMLAQMRERGEGFFDFAERMSLANQEYFAGIELPPGRRAWFRQQAEDSVRRQEELERNDLRPFGQFLQEYFAKS